MVQSASAMILGGIRIGRAFVGADAVVNRDVEPGQSWETLPER
jgi:serine acetyltransferase